MTNRKNTRRKQSSCTPSQIEEIVEVEIEYVCPKRGKVKQKVKMKKLKPIKKEDMYKVIPLDYLPEIDDNNLINDQESEEESFD